MEAVLKQTIPPFHLAFPVNDLESTRHFYGELLGATEGRSAERWIDFNFYGHQISAHLGDTVGRIHNPVDGKSIPVPHFGVVLAWDAWQVLADRLRSANASFIHEPMIRFAGLPGEQATMFLADPSGNVLEFKAFRDIGQLFALQ